MKKNFVKTSAVLAAFPLSALSVAISSVATAQPTNPIEEVLILGRTQSAAQDLVVERMEAEVPVDILGAEQISRIGDSTAAAALKRVPGVTLVDGKFVYVRGLGERYSSSLLNGATVPSPDLTRNVLPLDIFPSSIISSIAIQKGFTADMPAAFGGGNIDIRTNGIPDDFVFSIEAGTGTNSMSGDALSYRGGSDDDLGEDDGTRALSSEIRRGLRTYYTSLEAPEYGLSPDAIQYGTGASTGSDITSEQAEAINAQLATTIYRDLDVTEESKGIQDAGLDFSIGNLFSLGENYELGFLVSASYDTSTRTEERTLRSYNDPTDEFKDGTRTTDNVSLTGTANFGLSWGSDHEISSKNIFLRNTDDEVSIVNRYNNTSPFSSGQGQRDYDYRYEQRELEIYQLTGSHTLGYETKEAFGLGEKFNFLDDLELNWFFSDSTATTDIPSETKINASTSHDINTGEILSSSLTRGLRMMDIRFTDLEDSVESSGFEFKLPLTVSNWQIGITAGGKYDKKVRTYEQLDLSIGSSLSAADSTLSGSISSALSAENLTNPNYGYVISYQDGLSRSYLAATKTDAAFGQLDLFWDDTIRVVLGARYEDYQQFSAPWHPNRKLGSQIDLGEFTDGEAPDGVFSEQEVYPSFSLTYVKSDFWAQDFNLRFSASETVVRPDLREVSDSSYLDPLTDIVVQGNPDAIPSNLTNYDLRGEWFFGNGNNFTVSLFHKDIENPIEYFQDTGTEDSLSATIENAAKGKITGAEIEWLANFSFLGDVGSQFFVSGNQTIAESEMQVGDDLEVSVTNRVRPLRGASEYVTNIRFGFDSEDGKHAATLVYNVFGERVYSAGVGEEPDAYEQPFNAVDFSYAYYMNDSFTLKFKARNLLDENVTIQQGEVNTFERAVGQSYSMSFKYGF